MAWSRTCRPVPPVAANIVRLIRRSILDRCLPTGGLRVHAFAAGLAGKTVSGHRAIVVEPEEGDHLANIGVALDGAGRRPLRIGEHRVRNDSTLFSQLRPELLRKAEVSRPVAVQVADLPAGTQCLRVHVGTLWFLLYDWPMSWCAPSLPSSLLADKPWDCRSVNLPVRAPVARVPRIIVLSWLRFHPGPPGGDRQGPPRRRGRGRDRQ